MKGTAFCLLFPLLAWTLAAQEPVTEDPVGIESSPGFFIQLVSSPGVKLGFNWHFTIPFLRGDGPLTQGNNIRVTPGVELTPIDVHLTADAVWTPIAFLELVAGAGIGSGWSVNLFDNDIHGIGLNLADGDGMSMHDGSAFDGVLFRSRVGAALQGDLAAFFPGEWNHLVFRSFHEIGYFAYSRAGDGQAWFFENDAGENRNGFGYRGNLLIGYQMPIFLDMVALMAEAELFLTRMPGGNRWGDDRLRWTFSCVLGFALTERMGAALVTQFRTQRRYISNPDFPGQAQRDLHFTNRILDTDNPRRLEFYRVVLALTYRF